MTLSTMFVVLLCLIVGATTITQTPGAMQGIASGTIQLSNVITGSTLASKTYTVTLDGQLGNPLVGYAFALAGFQAAKGQLAYTTMIDNVTFSSNKAVMEIRVRFEYQSYMKTTWQNLKWTYLVVSSIFDGSYSNVWATFATFSTLNNSFVNVPIDPVGTAFLANGGAPQDCNIFIDPLLQVDLQGCQPVPVSDMYTGGKPIVHAYISGFQGTFINSTLPTIDIKKGTNSQIQSDSGWQVQYSSPPNGPKIILNFKPATLPTLQISFVFSRMDFYTQHYPLNSQLQYSSSHVYFLANQYNTVFPIQKGQVGQYNQHWVPLPDFTYFIYGLTGFTINSILQGNYQVMVNVDRDSYQVRVPNSNINNVFVSGDFFIKNVMTLCDAKNNAVALRGQSSNVEIVPSGSNTAVDTTTFAPLTSLSPSQYPIVYRYGVPSTTQNYPVQFKNTIYFQPAPSVARNLLLEIRLFQSQTQSSLIIGQSYKIKVEVNGQIVFDLTYTHSSASGSYISPLYKRAIAVGPVGNIKVVSTVVINSKASSQELYVLLAANLHKVVYDPLTKSCLSMCPSTYAINANNYPLTCHLCDPGMVYSPLQNKCVCQPGTYISPSNRTCLPCGPNCATCFPTSPSTCYSCLDQIPLINNHCGCANGQYLTSQGCSNCSEECDTCAAPSGLCLTCNKNKYCYELTCQCVSGWFDSRIKDCGICSPRCLTCSRNNPCLSCQSGLQRTIINGSCLCKSGYYQGGSDLCLQCDPSCASCSSSSSNCTSCNATYNRKLVGSQCQCLSGYVSAGALCVLSSCSFDPLCLECVTTTNNLSICTRCDNTLNRILDPSANSCICRQGYYDWHGVCKSCGSGCLKCSSQLACIMCAPLSVAQNDGSCLCPPRSYLSTTTQGTFCQQCPQLCLSCNTTSCSACADRAVLVNGTCQCIEGYFLNSTTGQCQRCGQGCMKCCHLGCQSCISPLVLSEGLCVTSCPYGYHLQNGVCMTCVQNCQSCSDYSTCRQCATGYQLYQRKCLAQCPSRTVPYLDDCKVKVCRACQSPCQDCLNSPDYCTSCPQHYHLYTNGSRQTCVRYCPSGTALSNGKCEPCVDGCLVCSTSPSLCSQCASPLIRYKSSCVQSCPSFTISSTIGLQCYDICPFGTYATNNTCSPCSYLCASCDILSTNCTSCKTGILVDFGVCANICLENQYVVGGVCYNCSYPCTKCLRTGNYCLACPQGMQVSNGQCTFECPLGKYYDSEKGQCSACSQGCATCLDSSTCLTCITQQYQPINGVCPFCPSPCQSCSHDGRCVQCSAPSLLFNGACLTSCPFWTSPSNGMCICPSTQVLMHDHCVNDCQGGFYLSGQMCLLCSPNCRLCQGSHTTCTACFSQDTLMNNTCVRTAPCHYGQQLISGICRPQCNQNLYFFQGFCITRCLEGFGINTYGACVRNWQYQCPEGSYYLEGQCFSACPSGYLTNQEKNQCQACPENCATCLSSEECYLCSGNRTLVQGKCYINDCPATQVLLGSQCLSICAQGTIARSNVCLPRCQSNTYFWQEYCYHQCPSGANNAYACLTNSTSS